MGNTPNIRFKGFTDDWEQRKLSEVAEFNPKSELPETFEYVDLESVVGTEMVSHRTETRETAPSRAQRLARTGDVFFQTVRPYQRNNYLFEKPDNNYVFSTGYVQMRPKIDAEFLMCFLQTDSFVKVVLDNCTGTSYPAINSNDLSNLEIVLPASDDEQRRIGSFISNLDNLITLHQRKCDETKKLKKYMLQKMFPQKNEKKPEIRFAGFTDDWEQRKSGDIAPLRGGFAFKSNEYCSEGVPIVRISNILSDGSVGSDFAYYNEQNYDEVYTLYDGAAVLAMSGATTGKVSVLYAEKGQKYYQNQRVGYFVPTDTCEYSFIRTIMRSQLFADQLSAVLVAGAQPNVSSKEIDGFEFMIPKSKDEQRWIGEYFTNLDNLITLHQRKSFSKNCKKIVWEQRELGKVFEQTTNFVNLDEKKMKLWSLTVEDGLTPKSERYNREFLIKKDANFKEVRPGDIVYNPMNMTLGAVGYNGMTKSVAVSGYYTTMVANEGYDSYYINTWLKSPYAILLYKTFATGSLKEKQRVQFPTLSIIPAVFPKSEEQMKIGMFFEKLDHLITLHRRAYHHKKRRTYK